MAALKDLPYWTNRVPDVATFALCDDHLDKDFCQALFGKQLKRFRCGTVRDHARVFAFASWLSAAAGEGGLETGEVAVPALLPRKGAIASGVAIVEVCSDNSSWARFFLGEPGFRFDEVYFDTDDGEEGVAIGRLCHSSEQARMQEGGENDWFMSLWEGPLWFHGELPSPAVLQKGSCCDDLHAIPGLKHVPLPDTKLIRCDGCACCFESANAWRCHVEDGCLESMFFPEEVAADRPEPMKLHPEAEKYIFPAPVLLKRLIAATQRLGDSVLSSVLNESLLMDRKTTLRQYLDANPSISRFVMSDRSSRCTPSDVQLLHRWDFCPLLRAGPLAVYRGSESRPYAIRRSLLQQGATHAAAVSALSAGCRTLEAAVEWLEAGRRATWSNAPRCSLEGDSSSRVGVAFDTRLDAHYCMGTEASPVAGVMRLEGPQRTHTAIEQTSRAGLLRHCVIQGARDATKEELIAAHGIQHVDAFLKAAETSQRTTCNEECDYYMNEHTEKAAILCAGAHAEMATKIVEGRLDAGLCLTRPPGHHAGEISGKFSGGCFLNNVAVAASVARRSGVVDRILILDWDVHHGDGTQRIFYENANILTISMHRFEHEPGSFYPSAGLPAHCGHGEGLGFNVNVAFTYVEGGYGDADYICIVDNLVLPIVQEFSPELVIIAAGFDSARGDPLGGFDVTVAGYEAILRRIRSVRSVRGVLVSLEGGYNPSATADGIEACLRVLLDRRSLGAYTSQDSQIKRQTVVSLVAALQCQSQFWSCLAGWEDRTIAGVKLRNVFYPMTLECDAHSPCWCCTPAACKDCNGLRAKEIAMQVSIICRRVPPVHAAVRCLDTLVGSGLGRVQDVVCTRLADIRGGIGAVFEVMLRLSNEIEHSIIVKIRNYADGAASSNDMQTAASRDVEANFFQQGMAEQLCNLGADCPLPLLVDAGPPHVLCMTRLRGVRQARCLTSAQVSTALQWLARLHAAFWGSRADKAVADNGLREQGCFWHLDARSDELARLPRCGWLGRLRMAARAIDLRLKQDRHQTICHGDAKADNMIFRDVDGGASVAFCDFEYVGKSQPTKDIVYCLLCADHILSEKEQKDHLDFYLACLAPLLVVQQDEVPVIEDLRTSYALSTCDFARWMAGIGWQGLEHEMKKRCEATLDKLDGGIMLASEEAYIKSTFETFPTSGSSC